MTGRPILTDDAIASMLRARASSPLPAHLTGTISEAVASAAAGRGAGDHAGRRSRGRSWPLLLVAAALLATAGGAIVLSRPTDEAPLPTPGPSAAVVVPSPSLDLGSQPCADIDAIAEGFGIPFAETFDPTSIVRTDDGPPANGAIIAAVEDRDEEQITLRFLRIAPDGTRAPEPLAPGSTVEAGALWAMVPAPSGRAIALAFDPYNGPVLERPDCADVFIVSEDFMRYRRVFGARLGERYTDPVWSDDGSRLYAIKSNSRPCTPVPVSSTRTSFECTTPLESSVVAWDLAADEVIDLGRPCEDCQPEGQPFHSPDGRRLAVPFLDGSAGYQMAFLDDGGRWSLVPKTPGQPWSELVGWLDEGAGERLRIRDAEGDEFAVDVETGATEPRDGCSAERSPDGRYLAGVYPGSPCAAPSEPTLAIDVAEVATGEVHRIRLPESSETPGQVGTMWSPDSRWLALRATSGINYLAAGPGPLTIYVAPADGATGPRRILESTSEVLIAWAWLAAVP